MKKSFYSGLQNLVVSIFLLVAFLFSAFFCSSWLRQRQIIFERDGGKRITLAQTIFDEKIEKAEAVLNKLWSDKTIMFFLSDVLSAGEWTDEFQKIYYDNFIPKIYDSMQYTDETFVHLSLLLFDGMERLIPEYGDFIIHAEKITDAPWLADFKDGAVDSMFISEHDYNLYENQFNNRKSVISCIRKIEVFGTVVGCFLVDIGLNELISKFKVNVIETEVAFYSLENEWIAGGDFPVEKRETRFGFRKGGYYYNVSDIEYFDLKIVTRGTVDSIFGNILGLFTLLLFVFGIMIAACRLINNKLKLFGREMQNIEDGIAKSAENNFDSLIDFESVHWKETDEMAKISNELLDRIQSLLNKQIESAVIMKETRLQALRYQINPHFIYNMLEVFRTSAYRFDKKLARAIVLFGKILRENITAESEFITIENELSFLEKCSELYNFRFNNLFALEVTCSEEAKEKKILRFILQPIVENAFVHGTVPEGGGKLSVKLDVKTEGDFLCLSVWNNGGGVDREKIEKINSGEVPSESLGIANIIKRIALLYGEDSYFRMESDGESYTCARLRLKAIDGIR